MADNTTPKPVTLDMSTSQPLTSAPVTLDMSTSQPLDAAPASQPGAYQTRKGGPILNANSPTAEPSRADEVAGAQTAIHAIAPAFPGGEVTAGAVKGLYQTGLGGASLFAKALNKVGIHSEEVDRMARGDVSPFSEAMNNPEGAEQHLGATAEDLGEWLAGEEGVKAIQGLAKLPQAGRLVKSLLNIGKAATIGATQGAVKGAAKGDAIGGAEGGAAGGVIGGTAGEVVPIAAQKFGSVLQKYAPDVMNALLRASKKTNYLYGKNPGQAIIDESVNVPRSLTLSGQLENIHGQLETAGDSLDSQVKQILSQPKVAAQRQDIVPTIQNIIEDAKKHITQQTGLDTPAYLDQLEKLENSILTKYDTNGNVLGTIQGARLSPAEISDVKKSIGKNTQWKLDPRDPQFQLKGYVNSVRKQIYGRLADMVEAVAPEIKPLNSRYANVIEAQGLLENRIAQEHGTGGWAAAARKGEWGTALGLIFSGHPYLGLPLIANRVVRSAPGRVLEARGAAATGKALQSPVVGNVVRPGASFAGSQIGQTLGENDPSVRIQFADGSIHDVHAEDADEALKRNPGAKVVSGQE